MVVPEPTDGWHLPDGPPPAALPEPPPEPVRYAQYVPPPPPGPPSTGFRKRPVYAIFLVAGILALVACCGLVGVVENRLFRDPLALPTYARPSDDGVATPGETQDGFGAPPTRSPGGSAPAVAHPWVLGSPAKAGTLRRAEDPATVQDQRARQRAAGIAEPYAAVYEDALDVQYRVVVTGQIGARFTQAGPKAAVGAWLVGKDPARARTEGWAYEMVQRSPSAIGGVGLCRDSIGHDTVEAWCAWAADGIVVEFVFARTPATAAYDRMTEMLPDLVTWA